MSAPHGGISPFACVGNPAEWRDYRHDWQLDPFEHQPHRVNIHPSALIEAFATVDAGTTTVTTVGPRSWVFKHAHVGHDCQVGAGCEIATGVVLGGHTVVEDGVRIGINATTRPYVRIGEGARIGCGSVVLEDVPAFEVWAGNPARRIRYCTDSERALALIGARADERWE